MGLKLILFAVLLALISAIPAFPDGGYDYGNIDVKKFERFEFPTRDIAVIVTKDGFFPEKITVFEGEKIHFFVTSTETTPGCFIIQKKELFLAANKGKRTEAELVFNAPGELYFHCPAGKMQGKLVVLPNLKKVRGLASEKNKNDKKSQEYWVPRE